jgi:hypothetical protein
MRMVRRLMPFLVLPILAGCVDVAVDIELTGPTTADVTVTQRMNADFYTLVKLNEEDENRTDGFAFCTEGDLTENIDGTATCTIEQSGGFADLDLDFGFDDNLVTFTRRGRGVVRVAIPTSALAARSEIEEDLDADARALIDAFFVRRTITLTLSGQVVVDSNMTVSEDDMSVSQTIPLLDLMNGTADLPDELYAVIRAR